MTVRRCFLAPSARQQALIQDRTTSDDVVIFASDFLQYGQKGLRDTLSQLEDVAIDGLDVLCMTETAVYLASIGRLGLNVGFHPEMVAATTKLKKQAILRSAGLPVVPIVPYRLQSGDGLPMKPPFVVKPDFGFASQLTMRIVDDDDWRKFHTVAANPAFWQSRHLYARELFSDDADLLDRFVLQPDLSWAMFLTMSFAFIDGVATSFIAAGERTRESSSTSFAWREFSAPVSLTRADVAQIDAELSRMAGTFGCRNGVYAAEVLWGGADHWYLEFDPRPQSGLVPDLLLHAFGIDLDELMFGLFLGDQVVLPSVDRSGPPTHSGVRVDGSQTPMGRGTVVAAVDRDSAGTLLRDEIWAFPHGAA